MTTINLYQNKQPDPSRFSVKSGNSGFVFSLGILVITLLAFAALKFYVPFVEQKNQALAATILVENGKLVDLKSLERVVDIQNRLSAIKENLLLKDGGVTRLETTKVLDYVGGELGAGVVISDFNLKANKVTISFDANNFGDASTQILNFKKSSHFADVELLNITRKENIIGCDIAMNLK